MKLTKHAIIAPEKLTKYLLQWQPENDKSKFLEKGGYKAASWERLATDIREQILPREAELMRKTHYGAMYQIKGILKGPNGVLLKIITIWMKENKTQKTKFITLYPDKEA